LRTNALTQTFQSAGFDPEDATSRAALIGQACLAHETAVQCAPDWAWFVPGRIEVFGKHTDYAGGRTLVAAVPRGFAVVASGRDDHDVRVRDARVPGNGLLSASSRSIRYIDAVISRLAGNFPGAALGADITLLSDLQRAAGLSSSSALVVSIATALIRRGSLEARDEWRFALHSQYDLSDYLGAVENGQSFRSLPGDHGVGTHGGSEDHTAIVTSRAGRLTACRYAPLRPIGEVSFPEEWRFIVASSGIAAQKTGPALELYNRAASRARQIVELWNASGRPAQLTLGDLLESSADADHQLRALIAGTDQERCLAFERRLAHFQAEDARVPEAMRAFLGADRQTLARLASASQGDAGALLDNQTAETRTLSSLAAGAGGFAATSFGAGFGGSVWALADRDEADVVATRWLEAYRAACPVAGESAEWFVARPSPGRLELGLT
jgi:galactokinase